LGLRYCRRWRQGGKIKRGGIEIGNSNVKKTYTYIYSERGAFEFQGKNGEGLRKGVNEDGGYPN